MKLEDKPMIRMEISIPQVNGMDIVIIAARYFPKRI